MKKFIPLFIVLGICLMFLPQALADLNDGLVTYYPFNGNANDESGNGNDGTVIGATLTADRFGRANNAYSFDGIDDYIKASADNLPTAERTVSLWSFASIMSGNIHLGYGGGGGPPGTSWLMGPGTLKYRFFHMSSHWNSNAILYYWPQPPVGYWYHFVVATDENGTRIYINGEEKASNGNFVTNTIVLNTDLAIGVAVSPYGIAPYVDANVGYYNGIIDDIRIYNRALSETEIQELYQTACIIDFNLIIENQTLSTTETFEACETITAGPAVTVTSTGDVTFQAGKKVILTSGFSVEDGGQLSVIIDPSTGRLP